MTSSPTTPRKSPKTVLLADDDTRLLLALSKRLGAAGLNVITCQDAYMAVDMARRHRPDVIVLDMNMPAGQGDSAHERFSKITETAHIPVIYLTGDHSSLVRERALKMGAHAVLHKPCDHGELLSLIMEASAQRAAA